MHKTRLTRSSPGYQWKFPHNLMPSIVDWSSLSGDNRKDGILLSKAYRPIQMFKQGCINFLKINSEYTKPKLWKLAHAIDLLNVLQCNFGVGNCEPCQKTTETNISFSGRWKKEQKTLQDMTTPSGTAKKPGLLRPSEKPLCEGAGLCLYQYRGTMNSAWPNDHKQKPKPKSALTAWPPSYVIEGTHKKFNISTQAPSRLASDFLPEKCVCFAATLSRSREEHNSSALPASNGVFPASSYGKASCTLQGPWTALLSSSRFFRDSVLYRSFSAQMMTQLKSATENRFHLPQELLLRKGKKLE